MDISLALIRRCKNREREAFDILLGRYETQLFKICCSYTRDPDIAMDIMQEVYIKLFRSIESFDESKEFYPWLKRIAVNTCINHIRDNKKHQHIVLESQAIDNTSRLDSVAAHQDLEAEIIMRDLETIINEAIKELPDLYRMSLTLRYLENMSYKEIASTLEISLGTVKSNISRARKILKDKLVHEGLLEV